MAKSALAFKRVTTLTLPSSLEVEAQKPSISRLVMETPDHDVPQFLSSQIVAQLEGKPVEGSGKPSQADLPRLSRFMDVVVKASVTWPVIVSENADYDNGQILITDLEDADRQFIFNWAMPVAQQAATTFRQEQSGTVATPSDVQAVQSEAV